MAAGVLLLAAPGVAQAGPADRRPIREAPPAQSIVDLPVRFIGLGESGGGGHGGHADGEIEMDGGNTLEVAGPEATLAITGTGFRWTGGTFTGTGTGRLTNEGVLVLRGAPDVDRATWIRNATGMCWGDRVDVSDVAVHSQDGDTAVVGARLARRLVGRDARAPDDDLVIFVDRDRRRDVADAQLLNLSQTEQRSKSHGVREQTEQSTESLRLGVRQRRVLGAGHPGRVDRMRVSIEVHTRIVARTYGYTTDIRIPAVDAGSRRRRRGSRAERASWGARSPMTERARRLAPPCGGGYCRRCLDRNGFPRY